MWAADNLRPFHMPPPPIIAQLNQPNKSKNHTSTFLYCLLFVKMDLLFFTLRKTGPAKTGAAGPFPPALKA